VDGRSDDPVFGTPGGDLAEFAVGLYVYFRDVMGKTRGISVSEIRPLFRSFLNKRISSSRPFYFHTDDTQLSVVFDRVSARLGRRVTVLPVTTPPQSELMVWLDELSKSDVQGCGHIRLMLTNPESYGLDDDSVIRNTIRVFYEQYWAAKVQDKSKFDFSVKLGSLIGKAIAIVSTSNSRGRCSSLSVAVPPSHLGSSIFVYTPRAASAFRSQVLTPFFHDESQGRRSFNRASFTESMEQLTAAQLSETLKSLSPANSIDLFSVNYAVSNI
jgi:hypothetical protein